MRNLSSFKVVRILISLLFQATISQLICCLNLLNIYTILLLLNFQLYFFTCRCEIRRIQDTYSGLKTAFLLRTMNIKRHSKWSSNYYFYRDKDCVESTYGLAIQGQYKFDSKHMNLTLGMTSLRIAIYNSGIEKEIITKYNQSCPGNLNKTKSEKPVVYTVTGRDIKSDACLHALGVGKREFSGGALFQSNTPPGKEKSVELLQTDVDLTKHKNITIYKQQWPLVRHSTANGCLTCSKIGLARFTHPPKLYVRNSTRLDGVWASARCYRIKRAFWSTRIDKFDGNKFDFRLYHMDHTTKRSSYKCHSPLLEIRSLGTFREIGNSLEVPGGVVYELHMTNAYLTPRDKMYEQVFNAAQKGTCGRNTWEVGKAQDVMETGGCSVLGITAKKGSGSQILVRTVRDENRNEMYIGSGTGDKKTGPLLYEHVMQSCNTYPVNVPTTKGPTYSTTDIPTHTSTIPEEDSEGEDTPYVIIKGVTRDKKPTSKAVSLNGVTRTVFLCLLLYLQTIRQA